MSKSRKHNKEVAVAKPVHQRKTLYALAAGTVIAILIGIYFGAPTTSPRPGSGYQKEPVAEQPAAGQTGSARVLGSMSPYFDFGKVSMAAGNVSHRYWVRNISGEPLTITKLSTSCMCTEATLIIRAAKRGPFGMAGHGDTPRLAEPLAPGETAQVDVVFDPAAHGPAGIGKTDRVVTIGSDRGQPLELRFTALVTP